MNTYACYHKAIKDEKKGNFDVETIKMTWKNLHNFDRGKGSDLSEIPSCFTNSKCPLKFMAVISLTINMTISYTKHHYQATKNALFFT